MLVPFRSKAAADFFMLEQHARVTFELMGKPFAAQGVISGLEAGLVLQQLNRALNAVVPEPALDTEEDSTTPQTHIVSLKQRAWPLLDMLAKANAKNVDVVWGVAI